MSWQPGQRQPMTAKRRAHLAKYKRGLAPKPRRQAAPKSKLGPSWWCGLSDAEFQRAAAAKAEQFSRERLAVKAWVD